ncbi:unnamed protein product [Toxocara canis]|uniref:CUB domain-containing protein n=1 Tax=Toxocara canis TaxID=6265 RepID=A0A183U3C3_TOXCA|nr:unnamed protein product [Toxocara canis]
MSITCFNLWNEGCAGGGESTTVGAIGASGADFYRCPATTTKSAAEFVTNSLSTRPPEFIYDPDDGCTFDIWFNRHEDVIAKDGSTLDEAASARLIVLKVDAAAYAHSTNHILPKTASEVCFDDTVKTPKELPHHFARCLKLF